MATCLPSVPVTFVATATDGGAAIAVTCAPASGSSFSPGTTTVTCSATDSCTNVARCTFTVTVTRDITPPVINCPSNIVVRTCGDREIVTYTVTASEGTVACAPPSGS